MWIRPSMPPRSTNAPKSTMEETVPFEAHALRELLEDFCTLVLAALFEENTTGKNNVVAVAIHLDDASFDFGAEVACRDPSRDEDRRGMQAGSHADRCRG